MGFPACTGLDMGKSSCPISRSEASAPESMMVNEFGVKVGKGQARLRYNEVDNDRTYPIEV